MCGGANALWRFETNGTVTSAVDGACLNAVHGGPSLQTFSCARHEPFHFGLIGGDPISSSQPHVRCTPMGRTCRWADETKKHPNF